MSPITLKRFLFVAPILLALAACGSSGNQGTPTTTPASPVTTNARTPVTAPAAAPAASTPTAPAANAATPAGNATSAGSTTATGAGSAANDMTAADRAAMAQAAKGFTDNGTWVEGKNYFAIDPPQPKVSASNKIEVVEVFSWGCPACDAAHGIIDTLRTGLPSYATMAYLSAGFRPDENWLLYQRAWYAAMALGVARKSYDGMFDANWKTGETGSYNLATGQLNPQSKWPDINTIAKFFSRYGIAPSQFVAVANSFAVNTQMKRADELIKDYKVASTPTIVINGRYRFDFQSAGGYSQGIQLAKWLIAKEARRLTDASAPGQ